MQKQHSAPQNKMRAKHQSTEKTIRAPTIMPTIAGYLGPISLGTRVKLVQKCNLLAVGLSHTGIP